MDNRLMHYEFPRDQIQLDGTMAELPHKIAAVVADTTDKTIVAAVLDAARAEGVTDLHLLDKKFVLDAIREKQERENPKPLTIEELHGMIGEPVWVQGPGLPQYGRWAIVEEAFGNSLYLVNDFTCHDIGKTWIAYRHKPKEEHHEV